MTERSIHEQVRAHYAGAALTVLNGAEASCCETSCGCGDPCCADGTDAALAIGYAATDRASVPDAAFLASLGCGNPVAVADLRQGERVLDLGSGGGIDVLLSAKRVGPAGRAFGLDMTDEMLALARENASAAGVGNVEFLKGYIESIPMPADSIDVVISNCVINLAADKTQVFREIRRVLKPGGRVGVADLVADDSLSPDDRAKRGSYAGCIAGALSVSEYRSGLRTAGLTDVEISLANSGVDGIYSAIIRAVKPGTAASASAPVG